MYMVTVRNREEANCRRICASVEEADAVAKAYAIANKTSVTILKESKEGAFTQAIAKGNPLLSHDGVFHHAHTWRSSDGSNASRNPSAGMVRQSQPPPKPPAYILTVFFNDTESVLTFDTKEEALQFAMTVLQSEGFNSNGKARASLVEANDETSLIPSSALSEGEEVYRSIVKMNDTSLQATHVNQMSEIRQSEDGTLTTYTHDDVVTPFVRD